MAVAILANRAPPEGFKSHLARSQDSAHDGAAVVAGEPAMGTDGNGSTRARQKTEDEPIDELHPEVELLNIRRKDELDYTDMANLRKGVELLKERIMME